MRCLHGGISVCRTVTNEIMDSPLLKPERLHEITKEKVGDIFVLSKNPNAEPFLAMNTGDPLKTLEIIHHPKSNNTIKKDQTPCYASPRLVMG